MGLVVCHCAQQTHTHLFSLAEELQKSVVFLTHPVFQSVHRLDQPMFLQASDSLMWLQVGLAERHKTLYAGLHGLLLGPIIEVTGNFCWFNTRLLFNSYGCSKLSSQL